MKYCLTIFLFCVWLPFTGSAQNFINKTKSQVLQQLHDYNTGSDLAKATLLQTDTTVVMEVSGPQPVTFSYQFDAAGKCVAERTKASCDSCLNKYLQHVLAQKKFRWKKINENQYVSAYSKKLMIELPPDNNSKMMAVLRLNWTKKVYKLLSSTE